MPYLKDKLLVCTSPVDFQSAKIVSPPGLFWWNSLLPNTYLLPPYISTFLFLCFQHTPPKDWLRHFLWLIISWFCLRRESLKICTKLSHAPNKPPRFTYLLYVLWFARFFRTRPLSDGPDMCFQFALTQTHIMWLMVSGITPEIKGAGLRLFAVILKTCFMALMLVFLLKKLFQIIFNSLAILK